MKPHIKYGLHLGLASILISLGDWIITGNAIVSGALGWLQTAILIIVQFLVLKEWREKGNGYLNFSKAFGYATLAALIGSSIYLVYDYLNMKVLHHGEWMVIVDKAREAQQQTMHELMKNPMFKNSNDGGMNDRIFSLIMTPGAAALMKFFGGMIFAMISALFLSLLMRKENPNHLNFPPDQMA